MKKVICLYRVSTIGQVDHDDIPMQRLACREYAKTHPDWEIIDSGTPWFSNLQMPIRCMR